MLLTGLLLAVLFAIPLVFLLQQSASFGSAFWAAFSDTDNLAPLGRSLLLASAVSVSAAVLGSVAAWVVVRTDLPFNRFWAVVLALPLVLPSYIGAFTLQAALSPGGLTDRLLGVSLPTVEGFWAAWAILSLLTYPYVYLLVAAKLRRVPANLEESARLLGHQSGAILRRVVLPQILPSVFAGTLLVFLYAISDFGLPQLLRYDTLTRVIFANLLDRPLSTALALQLGLLALLVAALERATVRRITRSTTGQTEQGRRAERWSLGSWRVPTVVGVVALAVASLVGPLTVLVYWAGRGFAGETGRAGSVIAEPASILAPLAGSATAGILAAVTATVVVLPIAYLTARFRTRSSETANALVVAGFAMPGLIIALALSFFLLRGPLLFAGLYQTLPLLVIAYVIHFGAQSLRAAQVAVEAVPASVIDVTRTLGTSRLRRLVRIELPLMAPSLLAGAGLVLLSALKELPATLLLSPPGFQSLATDVWSATSDAFWAEASVLALVLVALSALLTWLLVLRRTDALA